MDKGVYCLIFMNRACRIRIGALGDRKFRKGWHCYIGSARGPGGLLRVSRHSALRNRGGPRQWHVDYLLLHPEFSLARAIYAVSERDRECALAQSLSRAPVKGFGASDCRCGSHLFYRPSDPTEEVAGAFRRLDLSPVITTIMQQEDQVRI
jgi:Uri superfamily endonuclease